MYPFDFLLPLIVGIPLFMALIIIFIRNNFLSWIISVLTTLIITAISIFILFTFNLKPVSYYFGNFLPPVGIEYKIDLLNLFFIVIVSVIALLSIIWAKNAIVKEIGKEKTYLFYSMFLLTFVGSLGILITNDAFNLFVFLEISSLTTYILIALSKNKESTLASFNYLIIGTVSASFYVFGIGVLYMMFGTLNIESLITAMIDAPVNPLFVLAITLLSAGILIKIAIFPLAWWLPKSYSTAPSVVSAFLAGTASKVSIYMFLKIIIIMVGRANSIDLTSLLNLIIVLSVCSMFVYGFIAIKQDNIKMLLAFSSLSQVGFIMLGIGILNPDSINASLFIILSHALVKTGLFLCVGNLLFQFNSTNLSDLAGLSRKAPFTFFAMVFLLLSLAGIPATSGFWGKLYLIISSFHSTYWFLAIAVILASVLSFFYAWKIIKILWDRSIPNTFEYTNNKIPLFMNIVIACIVVCNIILTIYPGVIYTLTLHILNLTIIARG